MFRRESLDHFHRDIMVAGKLVILFPATMWCGCAPTWFRKTTITAAGFTITAAGLSITSLGFTIR